MQDPRLKLDRPGLDWTQRFPEPPPEMVRKAREDLARSIARHKRAQKDVEVSAWWGLVLVVVIVAVQVTLNLLGGQ